MPNKLVPTNPDRTFHERDLYAQSLLEQVPLYRAIIQSKAFQRLSRVRFLGAIDLLTNRLDGNPGWSSSRYRHCIGVAYLALLASRKLNLPSSTANLVVASALLHDIGHGPLSHSVEPHFRRRFGIDHKVTTVRLIRGDLFLGSEICQILADFEIDNLVILKTIAGRNTIQWAELFNSPLNVDTLDGISRTMAFFEPYQWLNMLDCWIDLLSDPAPTKHHYGDQFWLLKDKAYRRYIYSEKATNYDYLIIAMLDNSSEKTNPVDFLLDDAEFEDKYRRELHSAIDGWIKHENETVYVLNKRYNLYGRGPQRRFRIDRAVDLSSLKDIQKRYIDEKKL